MRLEDEVALLREENKGLRAMLEQALARIAKLEAELAQAQATRSSPTFFVKPSTQKKEGKDKPARRKRAKEHNAARRRDTPTHTIQHTLEQCPACAYPLRHLTLTGQRQVIELPPPQPVEITEHQLFKGWCARCGRWHYASVDLSAQAVGQGR